jgi:voltage-gated potassium channel
MSGNSHRPSPETKDLSFKEKLYTIIFEADTPEGKAFDVLLLWSIILSVLVVIIDSAVDPASRHGDFFYNLEWFFTVLFTVEYILRIYSTRKPLGYAVSFYGIVDLIAILPSYISLFIAGSQYLLVVRILRLLRIFRLFKLTHFVNEAEILSTALKASRNKITVFLFAVINIVVIIGALMYLIEGPQNGFTDIPTSMYWAIVTLTTVGYGDISPQTSLGQFLASFVMIIGYGIIAIPTGIVTAELAQSATKVKENSIVCPVCSTKGHDLDAEFCKHCGNKL